MINSFFKDDFLRVGQPLFLEPPTTLALLSPDPDILLLLIDRLVLDLGHQLGATLPHQDSQTPVVNISHGCLI